MLTEAWLRVTSPVFVLAVLLSTSICWSLLGLGWVRLHGSRSLGLALIGVAVATVALSVIATSSVLGRPWIAINNARFVVEATPYLAASSIAVGLGFLVAWLGRSRRYWQAVLITVLPLALVAMVKNTVATAEDSGSRRTLARAHPVQPIEDAAFPGMVYVPAGPFIRGSLDPFQMQTPVGNDTGDEQPVRSIYLDGFFIDRVPVTNRAFSEFVDATGYVTDAEQSNGGILVTDSGPTYDPSASWRSPGGSGDSLEDKWDHPVVHVSWYDANSHCEWRGLELPTEAQREKASRGVDGRRYPWGNDFDPSRANFCDVDCPLTGRIEGPRSDGFAMTSPVDAFPSGASPYGVLDMAGNVWEWTNDWYDPNYYAYSLDVNPQGPVRAQSETGRKVVRGGAWTSEAPKLRTASKSFDDPRAWRSFGVGFRCAASQSLPGAD